MIVRLSHASSATAVLVLCVEGDVAAARLLKGRDRELDKMNAAVDTAFTEEMARGDLYCCASCAEMEGVEGLTDRV